MHVLEKTSDTIFFSSIFAGLLILLSSAILYIFLLNRLRRTETNLFNETRTSFNILIGLIFSFILGYSAVLVSIVTHYHLDFNNIFAPILFLGSIFVLATAYFNVRMFKKLLKSREVLKKQALRDFMTRLPNRRMLVEKIGNAIEKKEANPEFDFSVIFIDILNFKKVNDSFGHYTGDKILIEASERLIKSVKPTDTVGRIGGDDFIILLENTPPAMTVRRLKALRKTLQAPYEIDGITFNLDSSYGICLATQYGLHPEEMINRANMAMRRSKQRGKNHFSVFVNSMLDKAEDLLQFENDFRRGVAENEFVLVFQPQYQLNPELKLTGFEALVRWNHPEKGWISPGDFIPMAESTGLIFELDRYVLEQACRVWADCQQKLAKCSGLHISVNISAHHITNSTFVRFVGETLRKYGMKRNALVIEVTESAFISDPGLAASKLEALKELGVECAIDDFGTGYSSLAYLTQFPTSSIKIDKSFIDGIEYDRDSRNIVRSVINLAHGLNMVAVAEGVENNLQLSVLKELDCDIVQGFLLARPLPQVEAAKLIMNS